MSNEHNSLAREAAENWRSGRALQAGRLIFENMATPDRPEWASSILESVVQRTGTQLPAIRTILRAAKDPGKWNTAHELFSVLRESTLEMERVPARSPVQEVLLAQLYLAENVAKVVYNATNPPDPFDEDSGWWIAVCLKHVLDLLKDNEFSDAMWAILSTGWNK